MTKEDAEANMIIKMTDFKGIQVPVLTNSIPLLPNTLLCRLKDAAIVQPKKKAKKNS